ncbi:hypothetical protein RHSIM_Rhsim05G0039600 [Rhododendron simsii]|uniref:Uncharacterized protein n=1 Tax=Rhododendron simsii TaxID=118357 RepID=A0A834GWA5_RHOSS|nr:hypothetical protein RHSIM_Rhsim05G0039600 [Rhododendron simsii]
MCINWVAGSKLLTLSGSSISMRDLRPQSSENRLVKDSGLCSQYERMGLDLLGLAAVSEAFSFVEGSWGGQTGCPSSISSTRTSRHLNLQFLVKRRLGLLMVKNP